MRTHVACIGENCVACGVCETICPTRAATIYKGRRARIDPQKCVACRKCEKACPAGIIVMKERRAKA